MTATLKQVLSKNSIRLTKLSEEIGVSYSSVFLAVKRNEPPVRTAEAFIKKVTDFLKLRGIEEELVWSKAATKDQTAAPQLDKQPED
ncbi:hypothetical protein OPW41_08840 [Vibrio europaeus]|uniref:hypothetical protein n=1 Tax=Vibrio europaeus TaxID=300876 RepID=UPI00233E7979|nr:hypothetical protein [Vibrio europaeus]MDC5755213.1 hypothetical protein [Vibrio europaeus]MDC5775792.1 hypothetical protein [Vibrio europaeus]MDC5794930.1 hypothetical protein [Vibrio europaeus]MDC5799501.1 hypothetical protein [Vibrio europaeus]MDC5817209.1 hypothetical protein [Vibrio europaeus]